MKAFKNKAKLEREDQKLRGHFNDAIAIKLFNENFCDVVAFWEFNRDLFLKMVVAKLFTEKKIKFFHQDNAYDYCEIIDTRQGPTLTVPMHFEFSDLMNAVDGVIDRPYEPIEEQDYDTEESEDEDPSVAVSSGKKTRRKK